MYYLCTVKTSIAKNKYHKEIMKPETYTNQRMRTCLWIVNILNRHKALTLAQINDYWTSDTDISDGRPMERRTFYNYIQAIYSLLHIVVECDRSDSFRYKITERYNDDKATQWLMQSFATTDVIAGSSDLRDRILLEDIPSGQEYLALITEAMRTSCKITFVYQQFREGTSHTITEAEPYCIKLYRQRWYVLVKEYRTLLVTHEKVAEMHVYALDRIQSLDITDHIFRIDPEFDAKEYFRYAFGTRVEKGNPPSTVVLRVDSHQAPYLRTLPLHASQREVETTPDYSIFELNVALTVELYLQILYYGSTIEVLAPTDLRDIVRGEVVRMAESYGIIEPPTEEELDAYLEQVKNNPEEYDKAYPQDVYRGIFH